jgi:hypothetical protein
VAIVKTDPALTVIFFAARPPVDQAEVAALGDAKQLKVHIDTSITAVAPCSNFGIARNHRFD